MFFYPSIVEKILIDLLNLAASSTQANYLGLQCFGHLPLSCRDQGIQVIRGKHKSSTVCRGGMAV